MGNPQADVGAKCSSIEVPTRDTINLLEFNAQAWITNPALFVQGQIGWISSVPDPVVEIVG